MHHRSASRNKCKHSAGEVQCRPKRQPGGRPSRFFSGHGCLPQWNLSELRGLKEEQGWSSQGRGRVCSDVGFIGIKMAGRSCQGDCHLGGVCPVRRAPGSQEHELFTDASLAWEKEKTVRRVAHGDAKEENVSRRKWTVSHTARRRVRWGPRRSTDFLRRPLVAWQSHSSVLTRASSATVRVKSEQRMGWTQWPWTACLKIQVSFERMKKMWYRYAVGYCSAMEKLNRRHSNNLDGQEITTLSPEGTEISALSLICGSKVRPEWTDLRNKPCQT